jgi:hypothetical protein
MGSVSQQRGAVERTPVSYQLKDGVSFCRVADQTVFLDLSADRYFCLSPVGQQSFDRLVRGETLAQDDLATLKDLTVVRPITNEAKYDAITPCLSIDFPQLSLLDEDCARPGGLDVVLAASCLVASSVGLRIFGLRTVVAQLSARKIRAAGRIAPTELAKVAGAFARLRYVATERDNCLTRSIAVAGRLTVCGAQPSLVIAVKLQPFGAHAWVQCDKLLVNDRHEFVRDYTPILVI